MLLKIGIVFILMFLTSFKTSILCLFMHVLCVYVLRLLSDFFGEDTVVNPAFWVPFGSTREMPP